MVIPASVKSRVYFPKGLFRRNCKGRFLKTDKEKSKRNSNQYNIKKALKLRAFRFYKRGGNYLFSASATPTATATVAPTIGLLPIPKKPIISTCAGTEEEPAN